jgi:hypothetical protein
MTEMSNVVIQRRGEDVEEEKIFADSAWVALSFCANDLTIFEETQATFLFNFNSRVSISFHVFF